MQGCTSLGLPTAQSTRLAACPFTLRCALPQSGAKLACPANAVRVESGAYSVCLASRYYDHAAGAADLVQAL